MSSARAPWRFKGGMVPGSVLLAVTLLAVAGLSLPESPAGDGEPGAVAKSFAFPRPDFEAGSYQGRRFLSPPNHLGDDSAHRHKEPVHAIADGIVRDATRAEGYGRVVVVEHRLPDGSYVSSIYGHLCGHEGFPLARYGARVKKGDVVGYVGADSENGDGFEHLHLGLRKGRYDGNFCGYAREPFCTPDSYEAPTAFLRAHGAGGPAKGGA